jgi:hypothetical protein
VGQPAPELEVGSWSDQRPHTLASERGKVVVLYSEGGITNRDIRRGLSPVEADGREVIAGLRRGRFTVSPEDVHHLELSLGQNACRGWILQ